MNLSVKLTEKPLRFCHFYETDAILFCRGFKSDLTVAPNLKFTVSTNLFTSRISFPTLGLIRLLYELSVKVTRAILRYITSCPQFTRCDTDVACFRCSSNFVHLCSPTNLFTSSVSSQILRPLIRLVRRSSSRSFASPAASADL